MNDKTNEDSEQGFNDAELEDIMSEIESLEQDFHDLEDDEVIVDIEKEENEVEVSEDELSAALGIEESDIVEEELVVEKKDAVIKTKMQSVIDDEVETLFESKDEAVEPEAIEPEAVELEAVESEIVELEAVEPETVSPIAEEIYEEEPPMEEKVVAIKKPTPEFEGSNCETQMDFSISGHMKLKLNFTIADQMVSLYVNEEDGFTIEMQGGAKFSVPIHPVKKVS